MSSICRTVFVLVLLMVFIPVSAEPWQWPEASPQAVGLKEDLLTKAHHKIRRGKAGKVDSFLVVRHGKLVFEKYYNDAKRHKSHRMASAAKSITSALVGASIGKGHVKDAKDPVYPYFSPYFAPFEHWDERKATTTVHDLLTMRPGWQCFIMDPKYRCGTLMYKSRDAAEAIEWVLNRPLALCARRKNALHRCRAASIERLGQRGGRGEQGAQY